MVFGYLINPKVIDQQSRLNFFLRRVDDDGNDFEETFTQKDFEKNSDNTNTFFDLSEARNDPYTGEIGKTLESLKIMQQKTQNECSRSLV